MAKKNKFEQSSDGPSRYKVWAMFDRIAGTYDRINRICSFGQDILWRNKVATMVAAGKPEHMVDIATGTADQMIAQFKAAPSCKEAIGVDYSLGMLQEGQIKLEKKNLDDRLYMVRGNAMAMPLPDNITDATTISFGIRNVSDVPLGLKEMCRVLKPGGKTFILEFGLPSLFFIRWPYLIYFRYILPYIGGIISGDYEAYAYLNKTVESFPYGKDFVKLMQDAGFKNVKSHSLTFGVAYIYEGEAP
ncbi:MAG: bifunctional demethylmenaquinone methyltransferase/2-methoxy-6-polyprenyl-1,4-benzoquinol methylase UbiE [Lentisphaeria bacterium]|nr:bifunctional demethylmenaquinone methyltransferase/2-methoxy-6-polyprenyl-1,4-benzoquinol methylase UbiE [Lentisphaeria bacterium]